MIDKMTGLESLKLKFGRQPDKNQNPGVADIFQTAKIRIASIRQRSKELIDILQVDLNVVDEVTD